MSTSVIKLNDSSGNTLIPVTSTEVIQHSYGSSAVELSSYLNAYIPKVMQNKITTGSYTLLGRPVASDGSTMAETFWSSYLTMNNGLKQIQIGADKYYGADNSDFITLDAGGLFWGRYVSGNSPIGRKALTLVDNKLTVDYANDINGGAENQILYQTASGNTDYITAPTTDSFLRYNGSAFTWSTPSDANSYDKITRSASSGIKIADITHTGTTGSSDNLYVPTGTTASTVAVGNHSHTSELSVDTSAATITYNTGNAGSKTTAAYKASTSTYGFAKYDSIPTSGSDNAITSDATYTALYNLPINNDNTYLINLYINSSGKCTMYNDPADVINAILNNKIILGEIDETTLSNNSTWDQYYGSGNMNSSIYPRGLYLCKVQKEVPMIHQGDDTENNYCIDFYDDWSVQSLTINHNVTQETYTILPGDSKWGTRFASASHDHNSVYNGNWFSGRMAHNSSSNVVTAAATATKAATIGGWKQESGNTVILRFKHGNTATNPTLKINSNDACYIYHKVSVASSNTGVITYVDNNAIKAGDIVSLLYWETSSSNKGFFITSINTWGERITASESTSTLAYLTGVTGATNQAPIYDSGCYLTTSTGELRSTYFNEGGTRLEDKYVNNAYVVTFTCNQSNGTFTCDRTYAEVLAAWNAKKLILGKVQSSGNNDDVWGGELRDFKGNNLLCSLIDDKGDNLFQFSSIAPRNGGQSTQTTLLNIDYTATNDITSSLVRLSDVTHNHDGVYGPVLKYTTKAASSNAVSFTSSDKMNPNTVYVVGSGGGAFTAINSFSIGTGALNVPSTYGIPTISTTNGTCPNNNSLVPTYQILFKTSSSFSSITLPTTIKWKDNTAPAVSTMRNKYCELTIMNNIATMNMIAVP